MTSLSDYVPLLQLCSARVTRPFLSMQRGRCCHSLSSDITFEQYHTSFEIYTDNLADLCGFHLCDTMSANLSYAHMMVVHNMMVVQNQAHLFFVL